MLCFQAENSYSQNICLAGSPFTFRRGQMLLTQDQEMVRDAVREFVQTEITPHAARWDKEHHFPKDVHQGLAALGAYGICVPEEYGGAGLDYLSLALVLEEIAAGDGGTSTAISVTNCP